MSKVKKRLIEITFPVKLISNETKKEKDGRPPLFNIHHWWNRTPLTLSRAMVLAALLPLDFPLKEFSTLMGLNSPNRAYNHDISPNEYELLKEVYTEDWGVEKPLIMDPFSGAGSIPFESLRMGCEVLSADYSPLACLIQKATIFHPARYGKKLWLHLDETFNQIIESTYDSLKEFYPKSNNQDVASYIHAWVVRCPDCGFRNPLVSQWWLAKRHRRRIYLDPIISKDEIKLTIKTEGTPPPGNISGGEAYCLKCNQTLSSNYILREILNNEDEMLLATITMGKNGKDYCLPTSEDIKAFEEARELAKDIDDYIHIQDLLPLDEIPDDIKGKYPSKPYLKYWHKLLNPRQKILFSTLIESIIEYADSINAEPSYREAILTYLAFIVGKHINRNCRSSRYNRKHENITATVSQPGIPFLWDHTEINPFVPSSGSLVVIKDEILKGLEYSENRMLKNLDYSPLDHLKIKNESVLESNFKSSLIVTDIPYFNDVQYAEMGDFFYVFEQSVLNQFMDLPSESPKTQDLSGSVIRSTKYFKHLFQQSFLKLYSQLGDEGLLILYFAHKTVKSWDYLINVIIKSGFHISAIWPVHTNQPRNPIQKDHASLESSLIVVARKREVASENSKKSRMKGSKLSSHLEKRIHELWDSGLRGTDLTLSLMGTILSIISENKEILSEICPQYDINTADINSENDEIALDYNPIILKDILVFSQNKLIHWVLDRFVTDFSKLDHPSQFYLFCRLCGLDGMSMKTANLILEAMDLNLEKIRQTGFVKIIKKGTNKGLKILKFYERFDITIQYQIDAAHIALNLYEMVGINKVEYFLSKNPDKNYNHILNTLANLEYDDVERKLAKGIVNSRELSRESLRDSVI